MNKADPEMRKLIRSHCMLGKNRGRILHSRRMPKTVVPPVPDLEAASAIPNKLGSELSLLRFADSVEPSTLWEVLRFTSASKQTFFPLERCFDFNVKDRSMFEPLTFDPAYLHAVIFGAQAYLDLVSCRSSPRSSVQMLKTIQLLRARLSLSDGNEQTSVSDPTILVVLTLAHVAHLTGDDVTAEQHLEGLCKMIHLRGGIAAFQNTPKLLTEVLRCDISIAIHKGTTPIFDFNQPLQSIRYQPQTELSPPPKMELSSLPQTEISSPPASCLDYKSPYDKTQYTNVITNEAQYTNVITDKAQYTNVITDKAQSANIITDEKLAESWNTLSNFCYLVNSAADKNIKLSDQILLNTMGSVMYALLRMDFPTNPINEAIRLGLLAFCSHSFLERRGIELPKRSLCEKYRTCLEHVNTTQLQRPSHINTQPKRPSPQLSLWFLIMGRISIFTSTSHPDDSAWIDSSLREHIALESGLLLATATTGSQVFSLDRHPT
ncbi:hypothetical protein A1O3_03528 [Capronia epimyces CBS 606.96]|uniref:Transcription factor domain-containing protein n=1 Tax=Capronia epimyces CBS 606.96 TaxID=1182542 RepID=W9YAA0_9EURO|nr:uncharacterized protein A1O3_03528 [Capronia epimyces CBS 606.96]EXJ86575.1 hypothetical protein A1O3_03528 [Capronia epimyces CBS 606.96]